MTPNIPKGTACALAACFIWGLVFIVPLFMEGFSSIEIALGCYLTYGILSSFIFLNVYLKGGCRYPLSIWLKGIGFALVCTIGYYFFVILSIRYSTPAICTLILGISPITIAFYGNWKKKECSYRSLILPSLLILFGLVVINVPRIMQSTSPSTYFLGLFCGLWALLAWSWYVVANADFLKKHSEVDSGDWSTLVGVGTLFWVMLLGMITMIFFKDQWNLDKYWSSDPQFIKFLVGCTVLGLLCSWLGAYLWNKASLYLPVSLAGQLTIFETLFGITFVYMLEQRLPPKVEFLGISFLLAAIVYGLRVSTQAVKVKTAKGL